MKANNPAPITPKPKKAPSLRPATIEKVCNNMMALGAGAHLMVAGFKHHITPLQIRAVALLMLEGFKASGGRSCIAAVPVRVMMGRLDDEGLDGLLTIPGALVQRVGMVPPGTAPEDMPRLAVDAVEIADTEWAAKVDHRFRVQCDIDGITPPGGAFRVEEVGQGPAPRFGN